MPSLTPDQVRHIAKLARLKLSEEEAQKFTTELTKILEYVAILQEVDTKNVQPTAQVTGLQNSFREDEVKRDGPTTDELLSTSPLPILNQQIQTPSAHS